MLDLFEQYATDESLENNGTWMDHMDGAELLIELGDGLARLSQPRVRIRDDPQLRGIDFSQDSAPAAGDGPRRRARLPGALAIMSIVFRARLGNRLSARSSGQH